MLTAAPTWMPAAATSGWLLQGGNGFPGDPVEGLVEPADPIVEALYQLVAKAQLVQRCEGGAVQFVQAILPYQQHGPVDPAQQPSGFFQLTDGMDGVQELGAPQGHYGPALLGHGLLKGGQTLLLCPVQEAVTRLLEPYTFMIFREKRLMPAPGPIPWICGVMRRLTSGRSRSATSAT